MTRLTLALLSEFFDPQRVLKTRRDVLARFVSEHASGNHPHQGPFVDNVVEALKAAARETVALHAGSIDFTALQFEVRQEVELLRMLDRNIVELERQTEILYRQLHPSDALRSIPGIGPALAPVLLGVLATSSRFRNQRHIRGFCGLFPTTNSSAGVDRPGQRITQCGSDRVKRALYVAADVARKIDPELAAVYWRLMVHKGHHHKQALCAVATRLVNRIYRVLKTGVPYVLRNMQGAAISVAEGKQLIRDQYTVPVEIRRSRRRHNVEVLIAA
jgi:transposase